MQSLLQDDTLTVITSLLALLLLVVVLLLTRRIRNGPAKGKPRGRENKKERATGALQRFARQNGFRFMAPVPLAGIQGVGGVDAVAIGYFGVLGVIALGYNGEIYGDATDAQWLQVAGDGTRTQFDNPALQAAACVRALRDVLFAAGQKKVPVEVVYVFCDDTAQLSLPRSLGAMKMKGFKELLKKDKYLQDTGLELDAVETALKNSRPAADETA